MLSGRTSVGEEEKVANKMGTRFVDRDVGPPVLPWSRGNGSEILPPRVFHGTVIQSSSSSENGRALNALEHAVGRAPQDAGLTNAAWDTGFQKDLEMKLQASSGGMSIICSR